jgi:hypothetical protein
MTTQKRENHFRFTENQLNVLETFHRRILKFLLYQLNDEFRIEPHPEVNWTGLGHSLIRVLKQCDERAFEMIIQGVLHAILKAEPPQTNPYSAAAMADAGVTHNKIFEEVLETMRTHNGENGELPMGAKVLGRDDLFATLWNLRILHASDRAKDHTSIIEPAFSYLENEMEAILEDTPDMVARLMTADLCLRPDGQHGMAEACLENLIEGQKESGRWDESPMGLLVDAQVACALLQAAPILGASAAAAGEKWLAAVFDVEGTSELPEFPLMLEESRRALPPDQWIESWLQAALAATTYLSALRPDHNSSAYLLAISITQENMLARAQHMLQIAGPYVPPLEEAQARHRHLPNFWQSAGPYEKSVYLMCGASLSDRQRQVMDMIKQALEKKEFVVRHIFEGGATMLPDPWENAALYMTGCKYGIALFDGMQPGESNDAPPPPAQEIIFQAGFMKGQGARVLVLWDRATVGKDGANIPGVQVPMLGMESMDFDSSQEDLAGLGASIEEWAASLEK